MRKLSKKQKLIILTAIVIILVIISLIIGANIIRTNIINSSYNSANNNSSSSNLLPEYIKEGITLGGVTGTLVDLDTSDATATEEDIAWGETAYVKGQKITGTKVITVAHGKESQKVFEENTFLLDDYGNRVKVPAGFKIAEDSATSVTGGVVIEDVNAENENTQGSQFVWIPIGEIITNNSENRTTITLGRYTFDVNGDENLVQLANNWQDTSSSVGIQTYYKEIENSTRGNRSAKNLKDFITRTQSSNGFYIGRYETGDVNAVNTQHTSSGTSANATCRKGVYPYNYVKQVEAADIARNMYSNSYFECDLVNSYAWDTTVVFIQMFSGDEDYSRQIRLQSTVAKCGEAHSGDTYDVRCNIYDMAGNVGEWSTETNTNQSSLNYCIARGGIADDVNKYTANRAESTTTSDDTYYFSFRVILYV